MIIMMDILVPLVLVCLVASTVDFSQGTVLNKTLFGATNAAAGGGSGSDAVALSSRQGNACCSLAVALSSFTLFIILFVIFVTIPSVLEGGTMAHSWDQSSATDT